ncbi:MAG: glycoside hydrolase family 9 protein [Lachnospiraceae bacterium]|nr:glycoside hydrolase family 9 protein [Lachnospiraceae bacterium]
MRKGFGKRIITAVLAGLLAIGPFGSMIAQAGQQLGQTDFDDGVGLPWHIVESEPAKMEFELKDGKYYITIVNPGGASRGGEDRWDCQFRHRGLSIVSGHQYKVHYEITASNAGKYYTKIGNLDGNVEIWHNMSNGYDLDSHWDPIWINANETKTVDLTFTAAQSMEVAEWAFHLGGDGQYTPGGCFPAGTVITFDNMSLIDLTSDENDYVKAESWQRSGVLTNQLGYFKDTAKKATLLCDDSSSVGFEVLDEDGKTVYEGKSQPFGYDKDSGDNVHILDFSDLEDEGVYTIKAENGASSREFSIEDAKTYSALLYDALNYFYQNRSGIKIEGKYITSGGADSLARVAGHSSDNAAIVTDWNNVTSTSGSQDVTGGWYDAGDHGKYVVNGGESLWLLQNLYEMSLAQGFEDAFADGSMNIPENNNGYPDLLDEARYELEWMFKMLVKSGDKQDMVYHKVHDEKWTGLAVAPADDTEKRVLMPPTTAATLNVSACAAQAARLWKGIDDDFADECLDIAKRTYKAAKANPSLYAPLTATSGGGGAYGDDDVTDEFYWAATELFITTGDEDYYDDMKDSDFFMKAETTLTGGESVDACGAFDWGHTSTMGTISVLLNKKSFDSSDYDDALESISDAAESFIKIENEQGYGQPYKSSTISFEDSDEGYMWGSNSFVTDNAIVIAYAAMYADEDMKDGVVSAMDYILGRNPMDYSYVTGYGTHTVMYPHHRWWSNLLDASFPLAPSGVMVGGPNSGMQDPWVKGSGWKKGTIAPAKCYLDHIEAWSVNECTINWNAPCAWLAAYLTAGSDEGIIIGSTGSGNGITVANKENNTADPGEDESAESEYSQKSSEKSDNEKDSSKTEKETKRSSSENKNTGNDSKEADNTDSSKDEEKTDEGGNKMALYIVIAILIFIFLIVTEIFVYKVLKLKDKSGKNE